MTTTLRTPTLSEFLLARIDEDKAVAPTQHWQDVCDSRASVVRAFTTGAITESTLFWMLARPYRAHPDYRDEWNDWA